MFLTNVLLFTIVVLLAAFLWDKVSSDEPLPKVIGVGVIISILLVGLFYLVFYLLSNLTF
jgi:hypothetical protein